MRDDAVLQFKCRVCGIFSGAAIWFAFLIPPLWEMRGSDTRDTFDRAEKVVNDVSPMAKHIENNAATVFGSVVPRGTLGRDCIALEDPITELTADSDNLSEKVSVYQAFEFLDTR